MEEVVKIPTGASGFDEILGGGLEPKVLTQIYGEAGSGKSTLALFTAVSVLKSGRGVIYIDTEGFSIERFKQLAGDRVEELASRLYLFEPESFADQGAKILECSRLMQVRDIGLIVLDSATAYYRLEQIDSKDALSLLSNQMLKLLGLPNGLMCRSF
jgi:RecA/RadA recombinase